MHSLLLTNIFSEWKWAGLGIRAFALLLFCSFALLLYCSIALLLFRSFALCSFAQIKEQLWAICSGCKRAMGTICSRSLMTKEQPWVNCSHHSLQKSNREGFAQVAHDKRAMAAIRFFQEQIALLCFCFQKMRKSLKKPMSKFPTLEIGVILFSRL